jgi:O-succinylhomoserine sulfhydrylase
VAEIAHAAGAKVVVDNVFATPIFQKPLVLGADIVVYSATKHIDGQGRVLGGAILGANELMTEAYKDMHRHTGPALSPFNAWVLLKGLETLELRVRRQTDNCGKGGGRHRGPFEGEAHDLSRPAGPPAGGDHRQPDDRRRQRRGLRPRRPARRPGSSSTGWRSSTSPTTSATPSRWPPIPCTTTHRSMPEAERLEIGLTEGWVRMSVAWRAERPDPRRQPGAGRGLGVCALL